MDYVRAAVTVGGSRIEVRDLSWDPSPGSGGWLRVEACGVCGSDIGNFGRDLITPRIQGHEIVGRIAALSPLAASTWGAFGVEEDTRVLLEEYLPCGLCPLCRSGDYRLCTRTAIGGELRSAKALRYGSTPLDMEPGLWGGYAEMVYLHPAAVIHLLPDGLSSPVATLALPLSNGIEWMLSDACLRSGQVAVIIGPGQMGLCCVVAAKLAGARMVIVLGLATDRRRLDAAGRLGADVTINVDEEDAVERVGAATGGRMGDVVIDVTSDRRDHADLAVSLAGMRGTVCAAAMNRSQEPTLNVSTLKRKGLTVKACRGHSYQAVETAIDILTDRPELAETLAGPESEFTIDGVETALRTLASPGGGGLIHATILPALVT